MYRWVIFLYSMPEYTVTHRFVCADKIISIFFKYEHLIARKIISIIVMDRPTTKEYFSRDIFYCYVACAKLKRSFVS